MGIAQQYRDVRSRVEQCCRDCGRNPEEVRLIAVSKTVDSDMVAQAVEAGALDFGENRPEQLMEKQRRYPQARWHFIGNLQSRRIKDVVGSSYLIHSVYKPEHLAKIDRAALECDKVQDILLEVNVSGEQSKGGIAPDRAHDFVKQALTYPHVRLLGLMTMAPQADEATVDRCFADLAALRDTLRAEFDIKADEPSLSALSMGMSQDWRRAVEQGATMVRIGRAIFSEDFA